jgi:hypothetical protein
LFAFCAVDVEVAETCDSWVTVVTATGEVEVDDVCGVCDFEVVGTVTSNKVVANACVADAVDSTTAAADVEEPPCSANRVPK